jgi:hypothetical protein
MLVWISYLISDRVVASQFSQCKLSSCACRYTAHHESVSVRSKPRRDAHNLLGGFVVLLDDTLSIHYSTLRYILWVLMLCANALSASSW